MNSTGSAVVLEDRSRGVEVGGKTIRAVSRSLPEQTALLEMLGVLPLPSSI